MGLLNFFKSSDINQGVCEYQSTANGVLIDVRSEQEYQEGRIPGSKNVPLQVIDTIVNLVPDKSTPLFVYCYSGGRSQQATEMLKSMGYQNVKNIGGIASYRGEMER